MLSDKKYGLSVNIMATRVMPSLLPQTVNPSLNLEQFTILLEVSGNVILTPFILLRTYASSMDLLQPTLHASIVSHRPTCVRRIHHVQQMCNRARVQNIRTCFADTKFLAMKLNPFYGWVFYANPHQHICHFGLPFRDTKYAIQI